MIAKFHLGTLRFQGLYIFGYQSFLSLQCLDARLPTNTRPSHKGEVTLKTAALYAGTAAISAFAFYKRPRLVQNLGAGVLLAGGTVQVGLAYTIAKWMRFGAYVEGARPLEPNGNNAGSGYAWPNSN